MLKKTLFIPLIFLLFSFLWPLYVEAQKKVKYTKFGAFIVCASSEYLDYFTKTADPQRSQAMPILMILFKQGQCHFSDEGELEFVTDFSEVRTIPVGDGTQIEGRVIKGFFNHPTMGPVGAWTLLDTDSFDTLKHAHTLKTVGMPV